ncbi:MAG: TIGR02611 family protein [Antricoccus sp.]
MKPTPKSTPAQDSEQPQLPDEPGLLDNIADKFKFRDKLEQRPALKTAYRIAVAIFGTAVTVVGLLLVPLPGPGWLIVIAGLAILASEFEWAHRILEFTKRQVKRWTGWIMRQQIWIRGVIALATLAFVYGVIVVMLHLTGVPTWIPAWVPLWR